MSLPKFTPHMISNQPDQTAYLLNKLVQEGVGGTGGGGGDIHLYPGTGQHTDGAMTQKATTDALGLKANSSTVSAQLAGKVDKEAGKGLSSNDFTDEDQTKLSGIQAGAQVNVQSDWNQTNTSADDYIKNKPTLPGPLPDNLVYHDDPSTIVPTAPYVNTGDIVNGAVTSDKIDWDTIGHWSISLSGNQTVTQATAYEYVDVPGASVSFTSVVGAIYLIIFTGALCCVDSSSDCYAEIMLNGNRLFNAFGQTYSPNHYAGACGAKTFTATQTNNTVSIKIGGGVPNSDYRIFGESSVQIIRIA